MNDDLTNVDIPAATEPPAPAVGAAGPIAEIDPAKLAMLEERLKQFKANQNQQTLSGSEAPDAVPQFDPTKWEVETGQEHFYMRATVEDTPEGPKWVMIEHQYMIYTGMWHIENSGQPRGKDRNGKMQYHAKGLDHIITDVVNGPEGALSRQKGWRLSALLPGGMSQGIAVFERQVKRTLLDPKPIVDPNEVPLEETTDEELVRMQERASGWSGAEAGTVETGESTSANEGASDPAVSGTVAEGGTDVTTPAAETNPGMTDLMVTPESIEVTDGASQEVSGGADAGQNVDGLETSIPTGDDSVSA